MTLSLDLTRVVVVGVSCSGKSTFARRLADTLGVPCVELDALYWGPRWTPRSEFRKDVIAAARKPRWVMDGNYSAVREIVWGRCTAIVWLDYSFARVFSRALRRTTRRIVTGERLYAGNRETIRGALLDPTGIPWWVLRTYWKRRREFPELLRRPEYAPAAVFRIKTPAAAAAFLSECAGSDCGAGRPDRRG